jgi:hypothetical protein
MVKKKRRYDRKQLEISRKYYLCQAAQQEDNNLQKKTRHVKFNLKPFPLFHQDSFAGCVVNALYFPITY